MNEYWTVHAQIYAMVPYLIIMKLLIDHQWKKVLYLRNGINLIVVLVLNIWVPLYHIAYQYDNSHAGIFLNE